MHEEDGQDGEEELLEEEEKVETRYKMYKEDPDADQDLAAE